MLNSFQLLHCKHIALLVLFGFHRYVQSCVANRRFIELINCTYHNAIVIFIKTHLKYKKIVKRHGTYIHESNK